ncbi:shikimate kinase [Uliginosibacterium sp. H1]|uniref:shikimate kinase n=1 Tax=Uliginosibacterium sp. H1 TaxID=3114757 RepID=UPI002E178E9D|nr:shikimate kinase [Uliginosibacterium sp. H1]
MIQHGNIYLIGLMGSGKTTIGRMLARRLGRRFLDSDHEIEQRTGVKVPVIFELEGEAGFRQREAQTIAELTQEAGIVLATGGGAVVTPANRQALSESGWVVYLDVPPAVLFERTRHDGNRPLLKVADPLGRLTELRTQRDPLYREIADLIVDGGRGNSQLAVTKILKEWEKWYAHST